MLKFVLICVTLFGAANLSDVSYYEILGLTKQATSQEIRQAYKKLAVKLHPDKNPDATEAEQEKFLKITEAYETLKDPDKRQKYDLYGSYPSYSRKYDYRSQSEYDNLFYNGLYHNDPFVETLSGKTFYNFLKEGFYFINFYSPFCPPCQNVADHWKKLAEVYKGIVRIGAVNCKYHNSFCYNSMRIGSYPSLLFYPNGKNGNYIYYRGDRTFESLDEFVMKFISSQVHVPTVAQIRSRDRPMAYVLGENRIERNVLTRIAYKLLGLVTLAVVEDDSLREELTTNDAATVVFRYRDSTKEIETTEEGEVLKAIVAQLPKIEPVDPNKLKEIRDDLRRGSSIPWVLYFSTKETDRLELHQARISLPDMHFGEIDCDVYSGLCASLQVESYPAWGVMKEGGGYQRVKRQNLETSAKAVNLHSLSAAEFLKVLDQEMGVWVLLVAPYKLSWDHLSEPFTRASHHFIDDHIHFGIMECTAQTDQNCRKVAFNTPAILVQNGTKRSYYSGHHSDAEIIDFVQLLRDTSGMELTEEQVLENILDASGRSHTWLVAHFPARCGRYCEQLEAEWMKVYQKLRPLTFVRVGVLNCDKISGGGFCTNIRIPTARLYPYASGQHFSINLQQVSEAPYILEWALEHMDDSLVQKHSWHTFRKQVLVEELNPSSGTKPWLIYFHSPRCYRCYEMYADFVVAGILLNNAVHLSKVNCITERGLCQHEQISSYPSLRLYLNRNQHQHFSSVINIPVRSYNKMLDEIRPHLKRYNGNRGIGIGVKVMKHDEL